TMNLNYSRLEIKTKARKLTKATITPPQSKRCRSRPSVSGTLVGRGARPLAGWTASRKELGRRLPHSSHQLSARAVDETAAPQCRQCKSAPDGVMGPRFIAQEGRSPLPNDPKS